MIANYAYDIGRNQEPKVCLSDTLPLPGGSMRKVNSWERPRGVTRLVQTPLSVARGSELYGLLLPI